MKGNTKISIIIPVYNDAKGLALCLDALTKQTYPEECVEIIVVDNGSSDNSVAIAKQYSNIVTLSEKKPGSYSARNKAISHAKHPVLAFLDADCIAHPDWLTEGIKTLSEINFDGLVAGHIEFTFIKPGSPSLIELFDSITYLNNKRNVEQFAFSVTANMFTSKKIFDEVGLFNSEMKSGGDREWGNRLAQIGKSMRFANNAIIYHHARHTYKELITKSRRVIAGVFALEKSSSNKFLSIILELLPPIRKTFKIITNQNINRLDKKIALIFLAYFFKLVGAFELLRISLGSSSQR